jgi:hypothetical protein
MMGLLLALKLLPRQLHSGRADNAADYAFAANPRTGSRMSFDFWSGGNWGFRCRMT